MKKKPFGLTLTLRVRPVHFKPENWQRRFIEVIQLTVRRQNI
jgi:hypothetical protein